MIDNNFAVFILSHGRADNVITYKTLRKHGYTGDIYIICDDGDSELNEYKKKYGDKVMVFSKSEIAKTFDIGDNFGKMNAVVYARNAAFDIAMHLGIKYFLVLDDDYSRFEFRIDSDGRYPRHIREIKNLDKIFEIYLHYYISVRAKSIAFSQGGDYIGGSESSTASNKLMRKCMNSFFCSTDRRFNFVGLINEDTTTYVYLQSKGYLFLTAPVVSIVQTTTQKNEGGLTDIYLHYGTYVKSFYSVMFCPSCVRIKKMGDKHYRLHHSVKWNNAVPKIISPKYKSN